MYSEQLQSEVRVFQKRYRIPLYQAAEALAYADFDRLKALAYIKAKSSTIPTPNLNFDQRVAYFHEIILKQAQSKKI